MTARFASARDQHEYSLSRGGSINAHCGESDCVGNSSETQVDPRVRQDQPC